jgi:hypothetical protein
MDPDQSISIVPIYGLEILPENHGIEHETCYFLQMTRIPEWPKEPYTGKADHHPGQNRYLWRRQLSFAEDISAMLVV